MLHMFIDIVDIGDIGIHNVVSLVVLYILDKLHSKHGAERMRCNPREEKKVIYIWWQIKPQLKCSTEIKSLHQIHA